MNVSFISSGSSGRKGGPPEHSDKGVDDVRSSSRGVISHAPRFATLMVTTIALLMLSALGVGVTATWRAIDQQREAAEGRLRDTAQALEVAVNLEIARRLSAVETLAAASGGPSFDVVAFDGRARLVAQDIGDAISLVAPDGTRLVSTRAPPNTPLASVPFHAKELLRNVFANGQPAVGGLVVGALSHEPVFSAAAPIRGADGGVAFVVVLIADASRLHDLLAAANLPNGGIAVVVDSSETIVARSDDRHDEVVGRAVLPENAPRLASAQPKRFRSVTRDGIDRVFLSLPVTSAPGWRVVFGLPASAYDASWYWPVVMFASGTIFVLLLATFAAVTLTRRMLGPLRQLTDHARLVAASGGESLAGAELPQVGIAELEDLRRGFVAAEATLRRHVATARDLNIRLTASQSELRHLFDAAPIGVARCDVSGRVLEANDIVLSLLGCSRAELESGTARWDLVTAPEYRGVAERAYAEAIGRPDGQCTPYEKEYVRRDGGRFHVLNSFTILDRARKEVAVFMLDLTDLRRLDQRLRESEARLRLFVDRAPAAIAMFDTGMHYLSVSRRFLQSYRIVGETPASMLGRSHYEIFPDTPDSWRGVHRRVLAGETLSNEEETFPRSDGKIDWVRWEMTPWYVADGAVGGALLFSEVITERKEAEAAVVASETRYREVLSTALEGIIVADANGKILTANPAALRKFGYESEDDLIGQPLSILMPPPFAAEHQMYLAEHRSDESSRVIGVRSRELVGLRRDGSEFPLELSVSSFNVGGARFFTGMLRDLTARRQAKAALRSSEERLRLATEAARIGIFDADLTTGEIRWDDRMRALWAFAPDVPVTLEAIDRAIHPDDRERQRQKRQAALDPVTGGGFVSTFRVIGATDGVERWLSANGRVRFEAGRAVRVVGAMSDVTAQRAAEAMLARDKETLEALVASRTADLEATRARLAQAAKMEALGRLAGGIAHDFNNVLQATQGAISLAERRIVEDPAKARKMLKLAMEATDRGAAVTKRLLTFARRTDLSAVPVAPAGLLRNLHELLSHTVGPKVGLTVSIEPGLPEMLADPSQLEMVLVNLVNNARDALRDGRGTIRLEATAATVTEIDTRPAPGSYVRLAVTDDGAGMPPELIERATEPFFTTKEIGKGTGLGLAMANGFAEQSGGALKVDSEVGVGTTVSLWLPVVVRAVEPDSAPIERNAESARGAASTVLLVDDEAAIRAVLSAALADQGHDVREAANPSLALDMLNGALRVDVLVTDLSMPGPIDGLDLISAARGRLRGLPAILITGHVGDAAPAALETARAGGPFAVLNKPFSEQALAAKVAELAAR